MTLTSIQALRQNHEPSAAGARFLSPRAKPWVNGLMHEPVGRTLVRVHWNLFLLRRDLVSQNAATRRSPRRKNYAFDGVWPRYCGARMTGPWMIAVIPAETPSSLVIPRRPLEVEAPTPPVTSPPAAHALPGTQAPDWRRSSRQQALTTR